MEKSITPSTQVAEITDGQIDKAVDIYRAMLRKHRSELGSVAAQQVLGQADYVSEQVSVLRRRVEAVSNLIIRRITVNRDRSPEQALNATGRRQYVDKDVVKTMPRGEGLEVDVIFFKVGRFLSDSDLDKEYELRGLVPADSYSQAAVNEADPTFADDHPNGTHWKDARGKWCYATFNCWVDERLVVVDRHALAWNVFWWFAGLRKVA